ncbi:MAG: DUF790 family protein, partial [Planctomycetota bacterium]
MLTKNLVSVRVGRKRIHPNYLDPEEERYLDLAKKLISFFQSQIGRRKREIEEDLPFVHGNQFPPLLTKGIIKILWDLCIFQEIESFSPMEARLELFRLSSQAWQEGKWQGKKLLETFAAQRELSLQTVQENLYCDLKEETVLKEFPAISPRDLICRYNTALAQGILIHSRKLEVHFEGSRAELRLLFRYLKFFRLLYQLKNLGEGRFSMILEGPAHLFHQSTKYGLQMANFFLALLKLTHFKITAEVLWGKNKKPKDFEVSTSKYFKSHLKDPNYWTPPELVAFYQGFLQLDSSWQIQENREVLELSSQFVRIPDFIFLLKERKLNKEDAPPPKSLKKYFLEVFGYWNLRSFRAILPKLDESPLLLALPE